MIRSLGGLLSRLSPQSLNLLCDAYGIHSEDRKDSDAKIIVKLVNDASQEIRDHLEELLANVKLLASPIGQDHVGQSLGEMGDAVPDFLDTEFDRAVWLHIEDRDEADTIVAVTAFDSRFERPDHWAAVRIDTDDDTFWDSVVQESNIKSALVEAMGFTHLEPEAIQIDSYTRTSRRGSKSATQISASRSGRKQGFLVFEVSQPVKRVTLNLAAELFILIDPESRTIDLVSQNLPKKIRNRLFSSITKQGGLSSDLASRLRPRLPKLDVLAEKRSFPCSPSSDGFTHAELTSVTLLRSDLGILVLNTKSGDSANAIEAWMKWSGRTQRKMPFGKIVSARFAFTFVPTPDKPEQIVREAGLHPTKGFVFRGWRDDAKERAMTLFQQWGLLDDGE